MVLSQDPWLDVGYGMCLFVCVCVCLYTHCSSRRSDEESVSLCHLADTHFYGISRAAVRPGTVQHTEESEGGGEAMSAAH